METYCLNLASKGKNVIICGDINTAHNEIDLTHPKPNSKRSGFLQLERDWITNLLSQGFIDTFRFKHPDLVKYSWWSMRTYARSKNVGWRIDYFLASKSLANNIIEAKIHNEIFGSDHCPISLKIKL